jgi:hypothetical protein
MKLRWLSFPCAFILEAQPSVVYQRHHIPVYAHNGFTIEVLRKIKGVYEDVVMTDQSIRFIFLPEAFPILRYLLELAETDSRIQIQTLATISQA